MISAAPQQKHHPSVRRGAALSQSRLECVSSAEELRALNVDADNAFCLITSVTSELLYFNEEEMKALICAAKEKGLTVVVDDAYGARLRPIVFGYTPSLKAGAALSPVTGGPVVDDTLSTDIEGVFAAGNVLHVHDLVDYVSEEAAIAGRNAAAYILSGSHAEDKVKVIPGNGVRYTVPQYIKRNAGAVTIRFRVSDVFSDATIVVREGETVLKRIKKRVLAPGEMEKVTLPGPQYNEEIGIEVEV